MDSLPQELLDELLSFMADKTKRQMRLANTKWFNLIKYNRFNLYFTRPEDVPAIVERLSKYSWPIEVKFIKSRLAVLNNATQATEINNLINSLAKLKNLAKLEIPDLISFKITFDTWMKLTTLTNLEDIQFQPWADDFPFELLSKLPKLTHLRGFLGEEDGRGLSLCSNLQSFNCGDISPDWLFEHLPRPEKLTKLHVNISEQQQPSREWSRLVNLKELFYTESEGYDIRVTVELEHFTALEKLTFLYASFLEQHQYNTRDVQLESAVQRNVATLQKMEHLTSLDVVVSRPLNTTNLLSFLPHLTSLRSFFLAGTAGQDIGANKTVCRHIPPSIETLTLDFEVDLTCVTHLTNLKKLTLNAIHSNTPDPMHFHKMTYLSLCNANENQDMRFIEGLPDLEELTVNCPENSPNQSTVPNISHLTRLKALSWTPMRYNPSKVIHEMRHLTNLQRLELHEFESDELVEDYSALSVLTNLTLLIAPNRREDGESLWIHLPQLTNLNQLTLGHVDNDDRLLFLTSFANLTYLEILSAGPAQKFRGHHITTLTSLQIITLRGCNHLTYNNKIENSVKKMPNLLCFSIV